MEKIGAYMCTLKNCAARIDRETENRSAVSINISKRLRKAVDLTRSHGPGVPMRKLLPTRLSWLMNQILNVILAFRLFGNKNWPKQCLIQSDFEIL